MSESLGILTDEKMYNPVMGIGVFAGTVVGAGVGKSHANSAIVEQQSLESQIAYQQNYLDGVEHQANVIRGITHDSTVTVANNKSATAEENKLTALTSQADHIHTHAIVDTGIGAASGLVGSLVIGLSLRHYLFHRKDIRPDSEIAIQSHGSEM